ncbi:dienelactone hydrolase family protein [Endozoicomonas sp. SM1973]|uniref:Dienelactone hydrolase family protein n=1 Tax=Spartinivicinus marinus TaxID=2994442 RepID=A0A853I443_9GAMM|nr:alpha/beta family hydrolase [Spartinivicinus marinus]MCX4030015.1 alpha/beta hydrolase [Spartinivicinus marinus]NYZ64741.1 dienelactone hydrolase family protein [Spartinivicinus marinus]
MKLKFACGDVIFNQPDSPVALCFLAHGAGAGMQSEFMETLAAALQAHAVFVVRFEFPYMQKMTDDGKRRPPDRADRLVAHWQTVVAEITQHPKLLQLPCFLAGKSMGGRMAMMAVNQIKQAVAAIGFGYPFYGRGKNQQPRVEPLLGLEKPAVLIQGTRDPMGTAQQVAELPHFAKVQLAWLEDGDHDFKPRKASGFTQAQHIATAAKLTRYFIQQQLEAETKFME